MTPEKSSKITLKTMKRTYNYGVLLVPYQFHFIVCLYCCEYNVFKTNQIVASLHLLKPLSSSHELDVNRGFVFYDSQAQGEGEISVVVQTRFISITLR